MADKRQHLVKTLSVNTIVDYQGKFKKVSEDGRLEKCDVTKLLRLCQVKYIGYKVRDWIEDLECDTLSWEHFSQILDKIRKDVPSWKDDMLPLTEKSDLVKLPGSETEDFHHSYSEEEKVGFLEWINVRLRNDRYLCKNAWVKYLPIDPKGDHLFDALKDGILLSKLVNDAVIGTVDERALNYPRTRPLNYFTMLENQSVALNSCLAIGCRIVNIRPEDMVDGVKHLQLAVLWQVIRAGLVCNITLKKHPGLKKLLLDGETLAKFMSKSPEDILIRWVNYQLRRVCDGISIRNFHNDIKDGQVYCYLLNAIAPHDADLLPLREKNLEDRMEMLLEYANNLNVKNFIGSQGILSGNIKLNTAFVAQLFNLYPSLDAQDQIENTDFDEGEVDCYVEETREEKSFRHWINSLNLTPYVTYLYEDLRDGWILLQSFDKLKKGIVDWARVNRPPFEPRQHIFKSVENCNYCISLGKQLGFKLIGVSGDNIYDGHKLLLGLLWQMIRYYTLALMKEGDSDLTEETIICWCNDQLTKTKSGQGNFMNFKDTCLRTSMSMIHLIDAIQPGSIGYDMVYNGTEDKEKLLENARYGLTMARKIGATVFAIPEDIVEGNHKMLSLVFARLMHVGKMHIG